MAEKVDCRECADFNICNLMRDGPTCESFKPDLKARVRELEARVKKLREALGAADKVFAQMVKNGNAAGLPRILRIGFNKARALIEAAKGV